jgi:hypothetical protein
LGESYSPQGCPILPPLAPRERASDLTSGDEPARYMRNVALADKGRHAHPTVM